MELFAASLIAATALFILYRSVKRKVQGKCDCTSCSSHCPMYEKKESQPK